MIFAGQCKFDSLCKVVQKFHDEWVEVEALVRSCRKQCRQFCPTEPDALHSRKKSKVLDEAVEVSAECVSNSPAPTVQSVEGIPPQVKLTSLGASTSNTVPQPYARSDQECLDATYSLLAQLLAGACLPAPLHALQQQMRTDGCQDLLSGAGTAHTNQGLSVEAPQAGLTITDAIGRRLCASSAANLPSTTAAADGGACSTYDPLVSLFVKTV